MNNQEIKKLQNLLEVEVSKIKELEAEIKKLQAKRRYRKTKIEGIKDTIQLLGGGQLKMF